MFGQKMPMRWKVWLPLMFLAGLAAGALITEMLGHVRRSATLTAAANADEKPEKGGKGEKEKGEKSNSSGQVRLEPAAQRNVGMTFERAQMRTVAGSVQATGVVGPNESRVAHIRPLANGRVQEVYVRLGDRVRAAQPLGVYDNIELGEFIGQYLSALAALDKANAEAQVTRKALDRATTLVEVGALARAETERRNAEYVNALASIESQKADLSKIEEKLRRFGSNDGDIQQLNQRDGSQQRRRTSLSSLVSPFPGVVTKFNAAPGETISPQDELFTVADLSTVWVQADVYERDIASIRPGQQARILTDVYPGQAFLGQITYISDFLDPKTRTARVRCEVPNPSGRLKLDMFATIELPASVQRQALVIPAAAVQQVNDRPIVFVKASENQFDRRDIELGPTKDGWVEITKGLKAGETVAGRGSFFLKSALMRSQIGGEE